MTMAVATIAIAALLMSAPVVGAGRLSDRREPVNPVSSLSKNQVSKLFLEKTTWDDGAPCIAGRSAAGLAGA